MTKHNDQERALFEQLYATAMQNVWGDAKERARYIWDKARAQLQAGGAVPALKSWASFADALGLKFGMDDAVWNKAFDLYQQLAAAPHPVSGEQKIVAHRLLNCLGEVVTEWHDGAPPKRFTDICGVVQTDVVVEVAYAAPPAAQDVSGLGAFALALIDGALEGGSFDGGDIQELAEKNGLLVKSQREESCGENCGCAEYGFPVECYRVAPALAAHRAQAKGGDS